MIIKAIFAFQKQVTSVILATHILKSSLWNIDHELSTIIIKYITSFIALLILIVNWKESNLESTTVSKTNIPSAIDRRQYLSIKHGPSLGGTKCGIVKKSNTIFSSINKILLWK